MKQSNLEFGNKNDLVLLLKYKVVFNTIVQSGSLVISRS